MKRMLRITVLLLVVCWTSLPVDAWYIASPTSGQTYRVGDTVTGVGITYLPTIGVFSFVVRNVDANGQVIGVIEGSTFVTPVQLTGAGVPIYVWGGSVSPDPAWTQSPQVPGMPGMFVQDHDTFISDALLPPFPYLTQMYTGPHTVKP